MPLTECVSFKAELQKGNRVQVPRLVRWQYKLEPSQVLKVKVYLVGAIGVHEEFLARMSRDGRITIPKLIVDLLRDEEESLVGYAFKVTLEPLENKERLDEDSEEEKEESEALNAMEKKSR